MTTSNSNDLVSYDTKRRGTNVGSKSRRDKKVLNDIRSGIKNGKFIPINRKKNIDTLAKMGFTWKDAKNEILHLSEKDYYSGPDADRDDPKSDKLWVFKKSLYGKMIYIKFKVDYHNDGKVKIISFHFDSLKQCGKE